MSGTRPPLQEQLKALLEPAQILSLAVYHLIAVVLSALFVRGDLSAFLHPSKLRDEAFSNFWLDFSAPPATPPKELTGSAALVPPLLALARGKVLEIGPGSGSQIKCFKVASPDITAIYAAEPATGLHTKLLSEAAAVGLGDKYHILSCSAETSSIVPTLAKEGLLQKGMVEDGVFDTIVCVRVLCSVPESKETMENLYRLLKPGGQMIIAEHVVNPWRTTEGSLLARTCQFIYMLLGWRFFVGDCELDRDTAGLLREVGKADGGWQTVDLKLNFGWTAIPYVSGRLLKKSKKSKKRAS